MIKTRLLTTILLAICYLATNAQTTNTSPLPSGETIIGNHLHVGAGNEVWTDATSLFFNYRGSGGATYFWNLGGSTGKSIMTLLNNGNVGIGTDNPQSKLEVNGDIKTNGIIASSSYFLSRCNGGSGLVLQNNGAGANLAIAELSGNSYSLGFNAGIGGQISPVLTWNASSNVGIGTQNPAYKLDVLGTIRAKEVLVNLDGGADFVFEKDYKLPTIEHVACYVQENKHLPDIPAATEMTKNGVSMGDLQVKLLQKVEELTLYAIQQNKEIEILKKRINELETK